MSHYILRRLTSTVLALWGIATLVFVVARILPGDPASVLAAQSGGDAATIAQLRAEYGLDRPIGTQYLAFLSDLVRLDLGRSISTGQSVTQIISQQAPRTFALAAAAMGVATAVGLTLGTMASVRKSSWLDWLCRTISVLSVSTPIALSGLVAILLFSLILGWLPATGQGTPRHLLMPAMVMGIASAGSIARVVRVQLLEVLGKDYIRVARAKGLSESQVVVNHALRNALLPVISLIGLQFGFMLGGAAVTESVFARQGLGRTLVDAILYQDYPVIQGIVLVSAGLYTLVSFLVDAAHGYLDPGIFRR